MKRRAVVAFAALILALTALAGAVCARADVAAAFSRDWSVHVTFGSSGKLTVYFSPDISSTYDLYAFDSDSGLIRRAVLRRDGEIVAQGSGKQLLMNVGLSAGQNYALELEGEGECDIELMRHAAGRSILMATELAGQNAGQILRPGSVVWHSISIDGARASIYITPEPQRGLSLRAGIYTASGRLAATSSEMPGGGCRLYIEPEEGEKYVLRVASPAGGAGKYDVKIAVSEQSAPDSVEIITGNITMREGTMRSVRARTWPLDSDQDVAWATSDQQVAQVDENGVVTAIGAGFAQISAYAYGGLCATIDVTVEKVAPEYLSYRGEYINVRVGDVLTPSLQVYPAAAADDEGLVYSSSAPDIVSVSETGEISALSQGDAVITVQYGELSSSLSVYVDEAPTRYRALLVSVQSYAQDVNSVRMGAVNTVYNLESLMSTANFAGETCEVSVEIDLTAGETYQAIQTAFADAQEKDVSILYISCHGYYRDGMTIMQFTDGSEIAACDLEAALRKIPGTIVILADFCDSGGLIAAYDETGSLTGGVVSAFSGENAAFSSSKYKVLASAALGQDSYRLSFDGTDGGAVTVFARALCDALGWSIDDQRRGPLNADSNYDGEITLWEAYQYSCRRVKWYLSRAGGAYAQDVQVYPEGDMFVLFQRE